MGESSECKPIIHEIQGLSWEIDDALGLLEEVHLDASSESLERYRDCLKAVLLTLHAATSRRREASGGVEPSLVVFDEAAEIEMGPGEWASLQACRSRAINCVILPAEIPPDPEPPKTWRQLPPQL